MPRCIECGAWNSKNALYCTECASKKAAHPESVANSSLDTSDVTASTTVYRVHGVVLTGLAIGMLVISWLGKAGGASKELVVAGLLLLIGIVETIRGRSFTNSAHAGAKDEVVIWERPFIKQLFVVVVIALLALLAYMVIDVYQATKRAESVG